MYVPELDKLCSCGLNTVIPHTWHKDTVPNQLPSTYERLMQLHGLYATEICSVVFWILTSCRFALFCIFPVTQSGLTLGKICKCDVQKLIWQGGHLSPAGVNMV